jgi:hypothetical protein
MAQSTLGPTFIALPSKYDGAQFFTLVGDQHKFGTGLQIWSAPSSVDPGTLLYSNINPLDPVVGTLTPPVTLPAQGGFKLECQWNNVPPPPRIRNRDAGRSLCLCRLLLPEPGLCAVLGQ